MCEMSVTTTDECDWSTPLSACRRACRISHASSSSSSEAHVSRLAVCQQLRPLRWRLNDRQVSTMTTAWRRRRLSRDWSRAIALNDCAVDDDVISGRLRHSVVASSDAVPCTADDRRSPRSVDEWRSYRLSRDVLL